VKRIAAHSVYSAAAYIILAKEGEIPLSLTDFDTYEDVISKIQAAA